MTRIIVAATPIYGHVAPLVAIAAALVSRRHHVTFLAGAAFKAASERTGAGFVALSGNADFDVSDPAAFPPRAETPVGPAQIDFDLRHLFISPIREQHQALQALQALPSWKILANLSCCCTTPRSWACGPCCLVRRAGGRAVWSGSGWFLCP